MAGSITEWEFTADVAGWINAIIAKDSSLPFVEAKCEQRGSGSLKRRDLTLLDKSKRVVLTGEVKLPYRADGGSPYNAAVVRDARAKAQRAGATFFFTWNVNECVLWETAPKETPWRDHNYTSWNVTTVHRESHMEQPMTIAAIQSWLSQFLHDFTRVLYGPDKIAYRPPDEKFIEVLESALKLPILLNLDELDELYKKSRGKSELDIWMRDDQGWTIYDDTDGIRENLERAAKFACYALVNKLVFHEALLKRYAARLDRLTVGEHIEKGDELRHHLEKYFFDAKKITGDYETVFGEDHKSIGNRIPFYSDYAVPHWRALINQIHEFDFSKLDYEIIGHIFERLISPQERHKYGQFYTRVEVVDLINSFAIRSGKEKIMDPACGGGTFLVRAYARKRELARRKHGELLGDIYGIDVSQFAAHLTTINLATRDLIDDENYPLISRNDFFDVVPQRKFLTLPRHAQVRGLGKTQHRDVAITALDAVVANPPYVRQEDIPKAKKTSKQGGPERSTKEYYQQLVQSEASLRLSGRSDLHCYFWPHAASFLKEEGYLCFLTSSQWLDVEYGFRLQEWILSNFEIVAIFESVDEPWFVGARVATAVTILHRQTNPERRMNNTVHFVQLRRPIGEILAHDGTTAGAVKVADEFRDEILALTKNISNQRYRVRLVKQGDLWNQGVSLGAIMAKSGQGQSDDDGDETVNDSSDIQVGSYYGGKWGVYVRAPDLWFELLDTYGSRFAPLGKMAEIRFGVKSGKDSFFFPKDCSADCLAEQVDPVAFESEFGVPRREVASGRVKLVRCGEDRGEIRPIEAKYLEPEVHSLMEVDGFTVAPKDCSRMILLVSAKKSELRGTYVLDYIHWGESKGWHTGATCAARVTNERGWYDLTGHDRGALFWPKAQQYKHAIPINDHNLQANCNLYDVYLPDDLDPLVAAGILNSSIVVLSKFQYGRPVGVEGNLKTEVVDVNMMLVPDPMGATDATRHRVAVAFAQLRQRKAMQFLSERRMREMAYRNDGKEAELQELSDKCELDMEDRRELDDAVLEMIGVAPKSHRQEITVRLYSHMREFFELTRQKEEKAIANKNRAKRRAPASPTEIAVQLHREIAEREPRLLRQYDPDFFDQSRPFTTYDIPANGEPVVHSDMFTSDGGVRFMQGPKKQLAIVPTKNLAQAELIVMVAATGVRGLVRIPIDENDCRALSEEYGAFTKARDERIRKLIEERTADVDLQERIYGALVPLVVGAP